MPTVGVGVGDVPTVAVLVGVGVGVGVGQLPKVNREELHHGKEFVLL